MAKPNSDDATVLAAQKRYEDEVRKLLCNWDKLTEHVRDLNALIEFLPSAAAPARVKIPTS